jgi:hypothetical protein
MLAPSPTIEEPPVNTTDTLTASHPTERWSASRIFGATLAIALGILTALVVAGALFSLVFAPSDRVDLGFDGFVEEETEQLDAR